MADMISDLFVTVDACQRQTAGVYRYVKQYHNALLPHFCDTVF